MVNTGDVVLEASMSRVQFTLVVDDLQKCFFDDKKVLKRSYHCGHPGSPNASGFDFEVEFGGESEDSFSMLVSALKNKTLFLHGLSVTILDENMNLVAKLHAKDLNVADKSEVKPGKVYGWDSLRSNLEGAKSLNLKVDVIYGNERCP